MEPPQHQLFVTREQDHLSLMVEPHQRPCSGKGEEQQHVEEGSLHPRTSCTIHSGLSAIEYELFDRYSRHSYLSGMLQKFHSFRPISFLPS